jgi:hypothetical protein
MAVLELVPLRSTLPTGRMTLRHSIPVFNPVLADLDLDVVVDGPAGPLTDQHDDQHLDTTTSQVDEPTGDGETTARKGGEAR